MLHATTFSFALILLSLFTLNYSSTFTLPAPTAHAANSSTTDLSLGIPTMLGMSITGSDACAKNITSGANADGVFENSHKFRYSISAVDGLRTSMPAGDYKGAVKYTATANTDSGSQIISDDETVYAYDYTGARQYFVAPKDGKYKLEVWGAGLCAAYRSCGGYSVGAVNLKAGDKLYIYVGGHGASLTAGFNGGGGGWYGGTCANGTATADCAKSYNGYAKITYLGAE